MTNSQLYLFLMTHSQINTLGTKLEKKKKNEIKV